MSLISLIYDSNDHLPFDHSVCTAQVTLILIDIGVTIIILSIIFYIYI